MYGQPPLPPDDLAGPSDLQSSYILSTSYSLNITIYFNRSFLNSNELVIPRSFLFLLWTIPALVLRFVCFVNLRVTQTCKGEKRVAVRIWTGGYATHRGEELKCTRGPNSSGGTKNPTRLTSKYVLWGKTKKAKVIRQLKSSLFFGESSLHR